MKNRPLCTVCLFVLIIQSIGLILKGGQGSLPAASIFHILEGNPRITLQGEVYQKKETTENQVYYLKNNSITIQNQIYYESRMIIYVKEADPISIGQSVTLIGELGRFDVAKNPGNFDQRAYYAIDRIYGFVNVQQIIHIEGDANFFKESLYQIRQSWKEHFIEILGKEQGGILSAMLLGEKQMISPETKELYQKNGIAHVLAISGLHVSFIGMSIYRFLRKMRVGFTISGIVGILVLTIYTCMIGFSISVFRAYIMLLLRIGADVTGRVYDMATALAVAAAITIIYQPLYLTDASFLLSYLAIVGILLGVPCLRILLPIQNTRITKYYAGISINVFLFPILLWFYYEISTYSFIWNIFAIPLTTVIIGCGLIGSICTLFCIPIASLFFQVCKICLSLMTKMNEVGSGLPGFRLVLGKPEGWKMIFFYVWLGSMLIYILHKKRKSFLLLTCGIVSILLFFYRPSNGMEVVMLDVGQGDCFLVKSPNGNAYLVDGGSSDVNQVGKYRIEPCLKSLGVGRLTSVFVSHGDLDHCNGIRELLQRQKFGIQIDCLVLPEQYKEDDTLMELAQIAKEQDIQVTIFREGMGVREGEVLWKSIQGDGNGNEGSMVLELRYKKFEMLFTGDVEGEGESNVTGRLRMTYDVLKVAHHGSKNGTTEQFLEKVSPRISLISAGEQNRYGHPHEETVMRLKNCGSVIYGTCGKGAVRLKTDGQRIDILDTSI